MWWWHRRSKAQRVTAVSKGKAEAREERHAKKLQALINEAEKIRDEGKLAKSADQYLAAVKVAAKYFGKVSMPLLRTLQAYSVVLFALDRPAALLTILTQCVFIARRLPQLPNTERVSLMLQLGDALIRTNRHSEAEKVILKALELMNKPLPTSDVQPPASEEAPTPTPGGETPTGNPPKPSDPAADNKRPFWNLAIIKSHELERAAGENYAKQAVELFEKHFGKTHSDTLSAEVTLATILYDEGQKSTALLRLQTQWNVALSDALTMHVFCAVAHLIATTLVDREENAAAEHILTQGTAWHGEASLGNINAAIQHPKLPKLKPIEYYRLLNDLAAIYWETADKQEEAKAAEDEVSSTLTSVGDPLPLSSSRTIRIVRATITRTGIIFVDFALKPMLPASREPLYHISPNQHYEIRFENPANPKERILLKRKVGHSTFVSVHSPLLIGFRHSANYVVDISVKNKENKLVRYVAPFVLPPLVKGSPEETFDAVAEEIRNSMKDLPKLLENGSPKDIATEEELLTKQLLQLDAITDEKHRDHRKALVESIQQLLQRIDAAKAARTSE